MNTLERASAAVAVILFVFGAGAGWNSLNNRIDKVDEKIGAIQKTLGSTPCTAILTRQLAAIEKGKQDARSALEGLSRQYDCLPARNAYYQTGAREMIFKGLSGAEVQRLSAQLKAVDAQLYGPSRASNVSGARRSKGERESN